MLEDDSVSRFHLELEQDQHGLRIRDLGSTNGTLVDGARINDGYLKDGARLGVGLSRLRLSVQAQAVEHPLAEQERFGGLIGTGPEMRRLFATLARVAESEATLLMPAVAQPRARSGTTLVRAARGAVRGVRATLPARRPGARRRQHQPRSAGRRP